MLRDCGRVLAGNLFIWNYCKPCILENLNTWRRDRFTGGLRRGSGLLCFHCVFEMHELYCPWAGRDTMQCNVVNENKDFNGMLKYLKIRGFCWLGIASGPTFGTKSFVHISNFVEPESWCKTYSMMFSNPVSSTLGTYSRTLRLNKVFWSLFF